jgi:hypothetical protein
MYAGYWWESQKERDHWDDQDVGGWTEIGWDGVYWIDMAQDRDQKLSTLHFIQCGNMSQMYGRPIWARNMISFATLYSRLDDRIFFSNNDYVRSIELEWIWY